MLRWDNGRLGDESFHNNVLSTTQHDQSKESSAAASLHPPSSTYLSTKSDNCHVSLLVPDGMVGREVELRQDGERGGRHGEREREGIFNPLRHRPFAGRPRSLGLHNAISTSEVIKAVWRMP